MCTPSPVWQIPSIEMFDSVRARVIRVENIIGECITANLLTGLDLPVNPTDAASKEYVDSIICSYTRTVVNQPTYTILDSDDILAVRYTPTGSVVLTLPKITQYKQYSIVDEGGNSSVNNIQINADALDTIIGQSFFTIRNDYNSITIYNDGTSGWFIR